ncbi:MAG: queuosine precursor transporter [Chloroflexota bacterium]
MTTQTNKRNGAAISPATVPMAAVIVISAYIAAQMIADITSVKIGVVGGLAVDMGTFIYPITFTLRDLVHKVLGKRNTRVLIVMAAVVNILMVLYTWWASGIPGDPLSDPDGSFTAAYGMVFGPLWRITVASVLAEVVSELADTEAYHWFVTRITKSYQWLRVLVSNAISVPIDNLIFVLIAFAPIWGLQDHFLTVPWPVVWEIFIFNLMVKFGVTLISLPLIYLTPDRDWDSE